MTRISDAVLAADDIERDTVVVPEWHDVKLELRGLTVAEANRIGQDAAKHPDDGGYATARWLVAGAFDPEDGSRVFDESFTQVLMEKSSGVVSRLAQRVMELSGITVGTDESGEPLNPLGEATGDSTLTPVDEPPSP